MSRLNVIEPPPERPSEPIALLSLGSESGTAASAMPENVKLRRTGSRAYKFTGTLLCTAMSYQPGHPFWYEISIYRKVSGAFVVAIKMFTRDENERDLFRVFTADGFDGLIDLLEGYDPTVDIDAIALDAPDGETATSLLALRGLGIRLRIEEARRQFGDLVGEILYELDAG